MFVLENKLTGVKIGVYKMPGRKKPCLGIKEGSSLTKYATFNNEFAADEFMEKLAEFTNARDERNE